MPRSVPWTPEEDAKLLELRAEGFSNAEAARALGRSVSAVVCRFGLLRRSGGQVSARAAAPWTEEEEEWLRQHYGRMTGAECGEALGRTKESVTTKARKLGIAKGRPGRLALEPVQEPEVPRTRKRKCHDCGRPTYDFRCPACWAKLRRELDCTIEDELLND